MKRVENKEFVITKTSLHSEDQKVFIVFKFLRAKEWDLHVDFKLTLEQWDHFINFLKKVKSKESFPADCLGYAGYGIDNNEIGYFRESHYKNGMVDSITSVYRPTKGPFYKKVTLTKQESEKEDKKEYRAVKRTGFTNLITFIHQNVQLTMPKEKFFRFQKFALNAENQFQK